MPISARFATPNETAQYALEDDTSELDAFELEASGALELNSFQDDIPNVVDDPVKAEMLAGHAVIGDFANEVSTLSELGAKHDAAVGMILHDPEGINQFLQHIDTEGKVELMLDAEVVISNTDDPAIIKGTVEGLRGALSKPMSELTSTAIRIAAMEASYQSADDADQLDYSKDVIGSVHELYSNLAAIEQQIASEGSLDLGDNMKDLGSYIIPFWELYAANQLSSELKIPTDESDWYKTIMLGHKTEEVYDFVRWLPPTERLEFTKKLMVALKNNSGIFATGNDLQMMNQLRIFLTSDGYSDTEKWVDTLVGALDIVGLAWVYKMPARLMNAARTRQRVNRITGAPNPTSVQAIANVVNPQVGQAASRLVLRDPSGALVRTASGTDDQIVHTMLPKPVIADQQTRLQGAPFRVVESGQIRTAQSSNILDYTDSVAGLPYTRAEAAQMRSSFIQQLNDIQGVVMRPSQSTFKTTPQGFQANVVYGRTDTNGWRTIREARQRMESSLGHLDIDWDNVTYFNRDRATGDYVQVADPKARANTFGNYLVRLDINSVMNPATAEAFEEGATGISFFDSIAAKGANRWFRDSTAVYNKNIVMAANNAVDRNFATQAKMNQLLAPFMVLPKKSQRRVVKVLEDGSKAERRYSYNELRGGNYRLSDKEIEGVHAQYAFWDLHYALENKDFVATLRKDKTWILEHGTGTNSNRLFAKPTPLTKFDNVQTVNVFDAATDTYIKMTKAEIDDLYNARGGQLGKLRHDIIESFTHPTSGKVSREKVEYVMHDPATKTSFRAVTSTDHLLNVRPGYYRRYYDNAYFIKKREILANGTSEWVTIAAGNSRPDADLAVKKLRETALQNGQKMEFQVARDRSLGGFDGSNDAMKLENFMVNTMRTVHRRRGQHLSGINAGGDLTGLARTLDPLEAIARAMQEASVQATGREFFDLMQARFMKTYGPLMTKKGVYPQSLNDFVRDVPANFTRADLQTAKNTWAWLNDVKGGMNELQLGWKNAMLNTAELIERAGGKQIASTVAEQTKHTDPAQFFRTTAFKIYLSSHPFRQILIQSSQALQMLAIKPVYAGSGALARDMMGVTAKKFGEKFVGDPSLGKHFDELYQGFEESGLGAGVDQNFLRDQILKNMRHAPPDSSFLNKITTKALDVVDMPFRKGTEFGFDKGEWTNLLSSWLTARKRWVDNNPGKDWRKPVHRAEIASDGRAISLNMNRAGKFKYNAGDTRPAAWAGVVLQFASVPQKMIQAMVPAWAGGSRTFTAAEKTRLFAFNATMFGAGMVGLNNVVRTMNHDQGWGLAPETLDMIADGFSNLWLNKMWDMMFHQEGDPPSKLRISGHLTPAGGAWFFAEKMEALFDGSLASAWDLAGAGPQIMFSEHGRLRGFLGGMGFLTTMQPDVTKFMQDPNLMQSAFRRFGEIFSGTRAGLQYSDYLKQSFADRTGRLVTASGRAPDVEVTRTEAIGMLFGIRTAAEEDFYAGRKYEINHDKALKQDAKVMVNQLIQYQQDIGMEGDLGQLAHLMEGLSLINLALNERDQKRFREHFVRAAGQVKGNKNPGQWLLRRFQLDGMTNDPAQLKNRIENDSSVPQEAKEPLYEMLNRLITQQSTELKDMK